jgi:hypothetical protein
VRTDSPLLPSLISPLPPTPTDDEDDAEIQQMMRQYLLERRQRMKTFLDFFEKVKNIMVAHVTGILRDPSDSPDS